jgi:hypothetical protein
MDLFSKIRNRIIFISEAKDFMGCGAVAVPQDKY